MMCYCGQLNAINREKFPWMYDVTEAAVQEAIIALGTAPAFFEKRGPMSDHQPFGNIC